MPDAQVLSVDLGTRPAGVTAFRLRYSTDNGVTWKFYSTQALTPTASEELAISLLSGTVYVLDGINNPTGNQAEASQVGNLLEGAWKASGLWSDWGPAAAATSDVAAGTAPVGRTSYPSADDVIAELENAGLTVTAGQRARAAQTIAAAIVEFERRTNRTPILAPTADSTRQVNPPTTTDGVLHLDRDLATLTSIAYQPMGGLSTPLTTTQYLAEPVNAPADGRPYERIVLTYRGWLAPLVYPQRASIYVTGRWGYATVVPDDIWLALVYRAAGSLLGVNRFGTTGGVESWKDADRSITYGSGAKDLLSEWGTAWTSAVANYRRINV